MNKQRALVDYLLTFVTPNKREKIEQVIINRTRHLTVVLEDMHQPHNASAVVRSCEIFGVQDLHVVEKRNVFSVKNTIAMGSAKWLSFYRYPDITTSINALKQQGYRIVATTPHTDACELPELPIENKLALVYGTEGPGLTQQALDLADEFVKIPMFGFTESFNVSVSVALCLQHIMMKLHNSSINWRLNEAQQLEVVHGWLHKILRNAPALEKQFLSQ